MMQHLGPETALMGRGTFRIFAAGGWLETNIPVELQSSVSTQTLVYHASASHCTATALCTARRMKIPHTGSNCTYIPIRNHTFDSILAAFLSEFLPPEANTPLRLQRNVYAQKIGSPAHPRAAAPEPIRRRIKIPRARSNSIFCCRRPTPRDDLKAPYFRNRQHLPCTREPPRSGGGSNSTTCRNPASALKFEFLPPEVNTPLRLQSSVFPEPSVSPARLRAAATRRLKQLHDVSKSRERAQIRIFAAGGQHPATTSKHRISATARISRASASRRVAAAEAITRRIKIHIFSDFLPLEANAPLRLQRNVYPQKIGTPAHPRAAAERRYIDSKSRKQAFFATTRSSAQLSPLHSGISGDVQKAPEPALPGRYC
ncbi:hypothetical protein C8R43DRAFT_1208950 [Mycena crocata]|nr:hypothetical protein C8R43DRAFT_1208950 [Mycena crocata]